MKPISSESRNFRSTVNVVSEKPVFPEPSSTTSTFFRVAINKYFTSLKAAQTGHDSATRRGFSIFRKKYNCFRRNV